MAGCKPKYKTADEMQMKIDEYFERCLTEVKPPTMCGLALYLGFASRQTLLNYKAKGAFMDTVTRARLRIESYAEERLYDRDGQRGAEFNLKCNFGWRADSNTGEGDGEIVKLLRGLRELE